MTNLSQKAEEAKAATEKEAKTKAEAKAVREAQAKAANIAKAANDRKAEALAKAAKENKAAETDLAVKDIESEKAEIDRMAIKEIEDGAVDALNKTHVLVLSASNTAAELDSGDSLVKPAKLSKTEDGSSVPSSMEALLGSSPELSRKEATARPAPLHMQGHDYAGGHPSPFGQGVSGGSERVGEVFSQLGTSNSHVSSRAGDFSSQLDTSNQHTSSTEGDDEESNDLQK